jgi:uncharacterized damage-inducible protein DinB
VLARKIEGVTDEQARTAACPPSDITLLGLIRHMADVERWWFRRWFPGENVPGLFDDDAEWRVPADATVADALAVYWAEIRAADANIKSASLDATGHDDVEPETNVHTLRRTIVHMIEEYARHCGHADLLRQALDGATGD